MQPAIERPGENQGDPAEDKNDIGTIEVGIDAPGRGEEEGDVQQETEEGGWTQQQPNERTEAYGDFSIGDERAKETGMWHHSLHEKVVQRRTGSEGSNLPADVTGCGGLEILRVGQFLDACVNEGDAQEEAQRQNKAACFPRRGRWLLRLW